ncbi:hypothetical protein BKA82DRAFT_140150 [Pisolithus tinctorius]|uniref:DUF6589 domain-containing protein n=1 Tax=Pisolithus tinctorius Marx 270 TaxID=870435 RepID=A0A0C3PCX2_PISTI|nr:hypothetical protein BKA82DRAFT_140150 [Pisolithus tinctorius]KIO05891.1 hypothetical protein M404DRAFT_140150 [Pisolithus tinctorius Marx 270]
MSLQHTLLLGLVTVRWYGALLTLVKNVQTCSQYFKPLYVVTYTLRRVHQQPSLQCDMQHENVLIINKYMLPHEELTHVMNSGDIGYVELCINCP